MASPAAVGAVLFAGLAVLARWGTASLGAVAGAQSVLGPGGVVGPAAAAAAAWLAAAALLLASPPSGADGDEPASVTGDGRDRPSRRGGGLRRLVPAPAALVVGLAIGPAAAVAVAGPQYGTGLALRVGATAAAVALAAGIASLRWQQATAGLALTLGVVASLLGVTVALGRVGV